jgi:multiple sugar transport system substrate-binding protein
MTTSNRYTRRDSIKLGTAALAAATVGPALLGSRGLRAAEITTADVAPPEFPIENGARLTVLRPSKFVEGDERLFLANTKKFEEQYGIPVKVEQEGWEDLRPKVAVAANVGSGPDVALAWQEDPHLFASKAVRLNDLATYLGTKYGGWFPVAEHYGQDDAGDWIAMPVGGAGSTMVSRMSWLNEAGFEEVPQDFPGFLELAKALQETGHPMGFALGNAVGDGGWTDWVLWGYGSALIDRDNTVIIDNPQTIEALDYAKALYENFIPGTLSWLDPSNNKAFLAGEIGLTGNGISIYYAAKNSEDTAVQAIAEDILHANYPVGPVGFPTQGALVINAMIFDYTPYPNAAKEYLRFMMEKEQYVPWQEASIGYWCHPLQAYDDSPVWTVDPKHAPYRDIMRLALPQSYKGRPSEAAAAAKADFVVLNMFQSVCAGQSTPEEAAREAQRRAERYFEKA